MKTSHQVALAVVCGVGILVGLTLTLSMWHTAATLADLRTRPGHVSAEAAMHDLMGRTSRGGRVEILSVGDDGPGLRYVVARVWAPATAANAAPSGRPREVGSYFLRMEQGWVHVPGEELNGLVVALGKALLDGLGGGGDRLPAR
jgi:hypothetical protein